MDAGDLRGIATILCMVAFLAVVIWAYAPSRKARFEEDAQLPFADASTEGHENE